MSNTKFSIDKPRSFSDIMDDTLSRNQIHQKEHFNDPSYTEIDLKKLTKNNSTYQHMQIDLILFNQFIEICENQVLSPTHELNKLIENFIKEREKGNKRR